MSEITQSFVSGRDGGCGTMFSRTVMVTGALKLACQAEARGHSPLSPHSALKTRVNALNGLQRGSLARCASEGWWSQTGSNRRPHACKARALPAELWPRNQKTNASLVRLRSHELRRDSLRLPQAFLAEALEARRLVGLGRLELPTSRLSSARSNQLSYKPQRLSSQRLSSERIRGTARAQSARADASHSA